VCRLRQLHLRLPDGIYIDFDIKRATINDDAGVEWCAC
jgi:hypothetical protein